MRPLELEIQAFGPYKEKVTLNFTDLVNQHLFLITGPTGAGKTTIFDAIVYALYGKTSGSSRNVNELKSQLADDETVSYVSLVFEIHGKTYTIKRIPKQRRPQKRGKKISEQAAEVSLEGEDFVYTKTTEVDTKIQEILGLTVDQFRQIVMLPQGEFKKLLESNSGDKETILRSIFNTGYIEKFQASLAEKYKEAAQEVGVLKKQVDAGSQAFIQFADPEVTIEVADETVAMQGENDDTADSQTSTSLTEKEWVEKAVTLGNHSELAAWAQEKLDFFNQKIATFDAEILAADNKGRATTEKIQLLDAAENLVIRRQALAEREPAIQDLRVAYQKYRESANSYQVHKQILNYQTSKNQIEQQLQMSSDQYTEVTKQKAAIDQSFKEWQPFIDKVPTLRQEIQNMAVAKNQWQRYHNDVTNLQAKQTLNQDLIAKEGTLTHQIDTYQKNDLANLQADLTDKQTRLAQVSDLSPFEKDYLSKKQEVQIMADEYEKIKTLRNGIFTNYQQGQDEYAKYVQTYNDGMTLSKQYNDNMAGELAKKLVDGQPCAVCGSVHHPSPAVLQYAEVTKEMVNAKMTESQNMFNQYTVTFERGKSQQMELDHLIFKYLQEASMASNIDQMNAQYPDNESKVNAFTYLQSQYGQQLSAAENVYNAKKTEKTQLEQAVVSAQEALNKANSTLQSMQISLSSVKGQIASNQQSIQTTQAEIEQTKTQLIGESLEALTAQFNNKNAELTRTTDAEKNLTASLNAVTNELTKLEAQMNNLQAQLQQTNQQLAQLDASLKEMLTQGKFSLEEVIAIHESNNNWGTIEAQIKQFDQDAYVYQNEFQKNETAMANASIDDTKENYQALVVEIQASLAQLRSEKDTLIGIRAQLSQSLLQFNQNLQAYQDKGQHYGELERLNQVANGKVNEYGNISFERYILGLYFDEILSFANARLLEMTQQRYIFKRNIEGKGGNGAKGLDLNVFDYQAGAERSVQSLSGGESFKAALALAVGLSDVIQNEAGGIEIGTLFVDEGFGTLDQESLQQAIETLTDLQQASGRIIGIISHVEELKQQIPVHLQVDKSEQGATAKFTGLI
ncbi:SMC family ATPase [Aerococcus agrisoli]|uniref:Nuclease SbcCD subunit C n=1 Tax=Aerococcus agrisoli TaxID=2487350 RepID=A0A3N4GRP2_9LACT|nr:SMC family ATPase [Aerococcus agrisoli]RPA65482.1 SMC family ATPase [Aerococcus agrisoli]